MSDSPTHALSRLFDARSVAVVGASASPEKAGYQFLKTVAAFDGAVYPINPHEADILGFQSFPSLSAVPGPVDLIVLVLPPRHSPAILREAAETGAGAALLVSGGFGEAGREGRRLQDEIAGICRDGGIRLLGPNTSGFIRPSRGLYATFVPPIAEASAGPVSIVAQSGGINITLAFQAAHAGIGISLAVGLGNAGDVAMAETIDYLAEDPATRIIALHLEGVPDGRRLFNSVARATERKPVVALPVGRADLRGFAESHTGNLIGSYALTRAALVQAGAVVVETLADLLDSANALSRWRLPPKPEPGIGVLTSQAGPGLLMTDRLRHAGATVPEIPEDRARRIAELLPPMHYVRNPVDTGRPSPTYPEILTTLANDPAIDALAVFALLEEHALDPVAAVRNLLAGNRKPVLFGTNGAAQHVRSVRDGLAELDVPVFDAPDRLAQGVLALVADARARDRRCSAPVQDHPPAAMPLSAPVDEDAAKTLVETAGIATPRRIVCENHDDARAALKALKRPVAVKILDVGIGHKTEVDGVHLDVRTAAALSRALSRIDAIPGSGSGRRGYLVEEMAPPGLEVILGGTNDPAFGPTVLLGLGGTAAEALGDTALRLAPLSPAETGTMAGELRGRALFDGFRGAPAVDREALAQAIVALGDLLAAHPEIREIDINPARLYPDGLLALDALVAI